MASNEVPNTTEIRTVNKYGYALKIMLKAPGWCNDLEDFAYTLDLIKNKFQIEPVEGSPATWSEIEFVVNLTKTEKRIIGKCVKAQIAMGAVSPDPEIGSLLRDLGVLEERD